MIAYLNLQMRTTPTVIKFAIQYNKWYKQPWGRGSKTLIYKLCDVIAKTTQFLSLLKFLYSLIVLILKFLVYFNSNAIRNMLKR